MLEIRVITGQRLANNKHIIINIMSSTYFTAHRGFVALCFLISIAHCDVIVFVATVLCVILIVGIVILIVGIVILIVSILILIGFYCDAGQEKKKLADGSPPPSHLFVFRPKLGNWKREELRSQRLSPVCSYQLLSNRPQFLIVQLRAQEVYTALTAGVARM